MPNFNWSNKPSAHLVEIKLDSGDRVNSYTIGSIVKDDLLMAHNVKILVDGQNYGDFNHGLLAWDYLQTFK